MGGMGLVRLVRPSAAGAALEEVPTRLSCV